MSKVQTISRRTLGGPALNAIQASDAIHPKMDAFLRLNDSVLGDYKGTITRVLRSESSLQELREAGLGASLGYELLKATCSLHRAYKQNDQPQRVTDLETRFLDLLRSKRGLQPPTTTPLITAAHTAKQQQSPFSFLKNIPKDRFLATVQDLSANKPRRILLLLALWHQVNDNITFQEGISKALPAFRSMTGDNDYNPVNVKESDITGSKWALQIKDRIEAGYIPSIERDGVETSSIAFFAKIPKEQFVSMVQELCSNRLKRIVPLIAMWYQQTEDCTFQQGVSKALPIYKSLTGDNNYDPVSLKVDDTTDSQWFPSVRDQLAILARDLERTRIQDLCQD